MKTPLVYTRAHFLTGTSKVILVMDKPMNGSQIMWKSNTTYSHCVRVLKMLHSVGLVTIKHYGRENLYSLTGDGKKIKSLLKQLEDILVENERLTRL